MSEMIYKWQYFSYITRVYLRRRVCSLVDNSRVSILDAGTRRSNSISSRVEAGRRYSRYQNFASRSRDHASPRHETASIDSIFVIFPRDVEPSRARARVIASRPATRGVWSAAKSFSNSHRPLVRSISAPADAFDVFPTIARRPLRNAG
jgi:hypothetical protein